MPVADASQVISGVAERYASSLFELALEAGTSDAVAADLNRFQAMIDESDDLKRLVQSPVFTAEDQVKAISAIGEKAGFNALVLNFLKVVAGNRRLFAVPGMVAATARSSLATRVRSRLTSPLLMPLRLSRKPN